MKTRIAIVTMLLGLFIAGTAMANEPVPATKAASKAVTELLTDEIAISILAVDIVSRFIMMGLIRLIPTYYWTF